MKDYAKDIRLNLSTLLTPEGAPALTPKQIATTALACAYSARAKGLVEVLLWSRPRFWATWKSKQQKGAATIMAMNNIFYRTQHHAENAELKKLPPRLRMNIIGKPGIEKVDFELACLAVSAIGGCNRCINSHVNEVPKRRTSYRSGPLGDKNRHDGPSRFARGIHQLNPERFYYEHNQSSHRYWNLRR